jgi:hypothetical protein
MSSTKNPFQYERVGGKYIKNLGPACGTTLEPVCAGNKKDHGSLSDHRGSFVTLEELVFSMPASGHISR